MGKGNGEFRRALKLGWIIHQYPPVDKNKPYQDCTEDEKVRMSLEVGFKQMTGTTYTDQWFESNEKYL